MSCRNWQVKNNCVLKKIVLFINFEYKLSKIKTVVNLTRFFRSYDSWMALCILLRCFDLLEFYWLKLYFWFSSYRDILFDREVHLRYLNFTLLESNSHRNTSLRFMTLKFNRFLWNRHYIFKMLINFFLIDFCPWLTYLLVFLFDIRLVYCFG